MTSDSPNGETAPAPPPLDVPWPETDVPRHTDVSEEGGADTFADLMIGRPEMLDPRYVPSERVGWCITTAVVGGGTLIGLAVLMISTWPPGWLILLVPAWGVLLTLLLWGTLCWPQIAYRHTSYLVTPLGLEIRRGVVWKTVITMPKSRTQHTDVMQGPLQRHFGIATLTTHTAGTENASVALPGLSRERALRIRDYLIRSTESDAV